MYENHHSCIFMNINEKNVSLVTNNMKNGCLPTKLLTSEQTIVVKMTKIETTGMHGYRAVFPVVNNANIYQYLVYL